MNLPQEFVLRMKQMLGSEYPDFENSYAQPRRRGLRVNTLKILPEQLEEMAGFHLERVPWIEGAYYYEEEDAVSRHPFYYAGLYYLQEPSAMTPASVLDVEPGMRVLDLCAAPGGKATALGAKLKGKGLLVANDISAPRCRALLRNIELAGIPNAFVTNAPGQQLGERFPDFFDRILLDAPCSGEGMFRKDESVIRAWTPDKEERCASVQRELIVQAAQMLRPGGKLLYSTCTFSTTENEEVIAYLLRHNPDMELLPIRGQDGFACGLNGLEKCVRLWPHRIGGEGHFLALLQKKNAGLSQRGEAEAFGWSGHLQGTSGAQERGRKGVRGSDRARKDAGEKGRSRSGAKLSARNMLELPESFLRVHAIGLEPEEIEIRTEQVYRSAITSDMVKGIPFVRNGIYLGECKKDRFEPSQALALACFQLPEPGKAPADPAILSLPCRDPRLAAFLRGETIDLTQEEAGIRGWRLAAADGFPLGWGKCTGTQLKNKLPAAWRVDF